MSSGTDRFSGRKQPTKGSGDTSEVLVFDRHGRQSWKTCSELGKQVKKVIAHRIPALFDEQGNEREDFAGITAEIESAVWLAARTIADFRLMNTAAETQRELEVLGRDKWIPALAGRLNQINMEWVSDEAWNEIAKAKLPTLKQGQALGLDTPSELIRFAKIATEGKVLGRVRDCDAASIAAGDLTVRVVNVLIGNAPAIGFSLAGYSARQKKPSPAVELLHDLGILAGVFLDHGTWRNKLAEARKAAT